MDYFLGTTLNIEGRVPLYTIDKLLLDIGVDLIEELDEVVTVSNIFSFKLDEIFNDSYIIKLFDEEEGREYLVALSPGELAKLLRIVEIYNMMLLTYFNDFDNYVTFSYYPKYLKVCKDGNSYRFYQDEKLIFITHITSACEADEVSFEEDCGAIIIDMYEYGLL